MKHRRIFATLLPAVILLMGGVSGAEESTTSQGKGNPMVLLTTSLGDIKIELFPDKAPVTVKNFLGYVNDGYYNGTVFHRVIPGFMIQGGGMDGELHEKGSARPSRMRRRTASRTS